MKIENVYSARYFVYYSVCYFSFYFIFYFVFFLLTILFGIQFAIGIQLLPPNTGPDVDRITNTAPMMCSVTSHSDFSEQLQKSFHHCNNCQ